MSAYAIDSRLFRDQFSTPGMRAVWDDEVTVQRWLDVEAALAETQAELGLVPRAAAAAIAAAAQVDRLDLDALKREMDRTAHPIVPLVRALAACCEGDAGRYVHWGATTQDIIDTGFVLQMRDAWPLVEAQVQAMRAHCARLAAEHRETPLAGRTHGQQALPVTFGYKCAVWVAELDRYRERLDQCRPRLLVGQFSGAAGTLASLGEDGLRVQAALMRRLGLAQPRITWHTARDGFAEAVCVLGMLAATAGKIAHEVYTLQRTELAELEEPYPTGKVGSSTMPHKRNPAVCESIMALARAARAAVPQALESLVAEHERDKVELQAEREYIPRIFCHAEAALAKTAYVLEGLQVRAENMRRNLDASGGLILSEAIMMRLSPLIGRQRAHDLLHAACMAAFEQGQPLKQTLMAESAVTEHLSESEIDALLAPENYTGLAVQMVDRVLGDGG
jgi:adenylosuccinate lyase